MRIQSITNLRNYNSYQVKHCNITKNYSTSPMAVDTFTPSVAFKGIREAQKAIDNDDAEALRREIEKGLDVNSVLDTDAKDPLIVYAGYKGSINCFRELRQHKVNMYAENKQGNFCFSYACFWGNNDIVQELVNDPEYKINYQDTKDGWNGLMGACLWGKEDTVDIILQRPDVDLALENKNRNTAEDIAWEEGYNSIVRKLQVYAEKMGNKASVINNQADAETEKSIREAVTEQIRKEEQEKAEKALADKQAELAKREEAIAKKEANLENAIKTKAEEIIAYEKAQLAQERKNLQDEIQAYDNLTNIQKEIIAEEVEAQKRGFRAFYDIKEDKPQNITDIYVKLACVLNVLSSRQGKLKNTDDEMSDEITTALQDSSETIPPEGLDFLGRVIDVSREKCGKEDLLAAIQAVKNESGYLDFRKMAVFVAHLSMGGNTIKSTINKLQEMAIRMKK